MELRVLASNDGAYVEDLINILTLVLMENTV